jgi:hypothetical protein
MLNNQYCVLMVFLVRFKDNIGEVIYLASTVNYYFLLFLSCFRVFRGGCFFLLFLPLWPLRLPGDSVFSLHLFLRELQMDSACPELEIFEPDDESKGCPSQQIMLLL